MRKIYYLILFICATVVLLQAIHPAWKDHLVFDVYTYFERSTYFINHLNLSNIANEYHPGAITFFILLSPFLLINSSVEAFLNIILSTNFILIFLIAYMIERLTASKNILIFSLLILFTGPIIFYRFELLVVCLTMASYYFFKKNLALVSIIFLGLAILTKLYPIIYLPYFLFIRFKERGLKEFVKLSLVFCTFIISFLLAYLSLLQIGLTEFIYSLNYHSAKPVGVEGVWASIISLFSIITAGSPPTLVAGNRTWGVSTENFFLPLWIIDNFWILAIEIVYLLILSFKKSSKLLESILIITLTVLIFSKLSAPQYLIWFLFLLPLISFEKYLNNIRYTFLLLMSFCVAFLSQYIYPLNYDNFLQFFNNGSNSYLFYLNVFRNICLIFIFYILVVKLNKNED